jgi:hypothetical protein
MQKKNLGSPDEVHHFGRITKYSCSQLRRRISRRRALWPAREFGEQPSEVAAGEGPLKGLGRLGIAHLKPEEAILEGGERREVVWGEDFALDDREVDLDLVEPTGVNRRVHEHEPWPGGLQSRGGAGALVGGAVVDDPEHAASGPIGFLTLMTCATKRSKGARPVLSSQRPNTLARCTSHAAR